MPILQIKRGTQSQLETAALSSGLREGEPYLVTDKPRLAVGTATNAWEPIATLRDARFQRGAGFYAAGRLPVLIPVACAIKVASIITEGGPGSCTFDVQRNGVSLCAASKPTISNGTTYGDITLNGWTVTLAALDTLWIVCESLSTFTLADLTLILEPT